ncbi:MAG: hypothetical protein IKU22_08385 [Alistipes sp.]|nr:hypothetical protein [Alistipes sp.]
MTNYEYPKIDRKDLALDFAIRDAKILSGTTEYGYKIEERVPYYNYMSKNTWEKFLQDMSPLHQAQFRDADGGELDEYKKRGKTVPPKMASYGSSSRFLYGLSERIPGFHFEKLLPTRVGGTANLDGYLIRNNQDIFIEAKCREIYSANKNKISSVYFKLYKYIAGKTRTTRKFEYDEKLNIFTIDGKVVKHCDIKQLICHFLAICANILENGANRNVKFIYLIFNPNKNTDFTKCEKVKKYKEEILKDYNDAITYNDLNWLFDIIMDYQAEHLKINKPSDYRFEFELMDQDRYKEMFICQ